MWKKCNETMPFIRYKHGEYVFADAVPSISWVYKFDSKRNFICKMSYTKWCEENAKRKKHGGYFVYQRTADGQLHEVATAMSRAQAKTIASNMQVDCLPPMVVAKNLESAKHSATVRDLARIKKHTIIGDVVGHVHRTLGYYPCVTEQEIQKYL